MISRTAAVGPTGVKGKVAENRTISDDRGGLRESRKDSGDLEPTLGDGDGESLLEV